jgi:hypothetical protein
VKETGFVRCIFVKNMYMQTAKKLCMALLLLTTGAGAMAQPGQKNRKQVPVKKWRDDSLLWIRNHPPAQVINNNQNGANPNNANRTQANRPNQTKLDDLKNPFDTTKKIQAAQPDNFSWGASNPTSGQQMKQPDSVNVSAPRKVKPVTRASGAKRRGG